MKKEVNIYLVLSISTILLTILIFLLPGDGISDIMLALISVTSFLFGIFFAAQFSNRENRLGSIRAMLRDDDAHLIAIYKTSSDFGEETQEKVKELIDRFLRTSLDYDLMDYEKAMPEFYNLYDYVTKLKPKTEQQDAAYECLLGSLEESLANKKEVIYKLNEKMSGYEWGSLIGLAVIMVSTLFIMNNDSVAYKVITVLLSNSVVLLMLILWNIDTLYWKEETWLWKPLEELFKELDLLPYLPSGVLEKSRKKFKKGTYRVATNGPKNTSENDEKFDTVEIS